jgi:hypothetical protein
MVFSAYEKLFWRFLHGRNVGKQWFIDTSLYTSKRGSVVVISGYGTDGPALHYLHRKETFLFSKNPLGSYSVSKDCCFLQEKRPGHKPDHSFLPTANLKMYGVALST